MQPLAQVGAGLGAVRDGLEVDGDDVGVGLAGERDDVVVVHHDRVAGVEARGAGVDDDRGRLVLGDRGADLVAQDRVAGDVEARLAGRVQDEAGHRRHRLRELAGAVLARRCARSAGRRASRRRAPGGRR